MAEGPPSGLSESLAGSPTSTNSSDVGSSLWVSVGAWLTPLSDSVAGSTVFKSVRLRDLFVVALNVQESYAVKLQRMRH